VDIFLTDTNNTPMYIRTVEWVGRLTIIENAGAGDTTEVEKQISSDASTPNVCCLQDLLQIQNPMMREIDSASSHLHHRFH
jgi:hypothetical protein